MAAVPQEIRQYVITFVKRKYEWQIKDLQKRVDLLEKTVSTLLKMQEKQKKKKKK
jgi:hypothetical protein